MKRALLRLAGGAVLGLGIVIGIVLIALGSTGVLRTAAPAWTTRIKVLDHPFDVSVTGLIRLATAPGAAWILDGRNWRTSIGTLRFSRAGTSLIVHCAPCKLNHEMFATETVTIESAQLTLQRDDDRVHGALTIGLIDLPFSARLQAQQIDIEWNLPRTAIGTIYRVMATAIPEARFGRIEGTVTASGRVSLPSRRGSVAISFEGFEVGGLGTESLQSGWFKLRCDGAQGNRDWIITGDNERAWTPREKLGDFLKAAVVAAEDQRFYEHGGIDLEELHNLLGTLDGRPQRGASTITQQLARTLFTGPERTVVRKLRELLYATEMERTLDKDRILDLYLNTVDWGPGLCGAKAAARAYFGKPPARLTAIEAAWMAGILRNPHAAYQREIVARNPQRQRAQDIVMQMREFGRADRIRWSKEPLVFPTAKGASPVRSDWMANATAHRTPTAPERR